jgi:hypothetical protein
MVMQTVEQVVGEYLAAFSATEALESALADHEAYDASYGTDRASALVDQMVLQRLYYKTLN